MYTQTLSSSNRINSLQFVEYGKLNSVICPLSPQIIYIGKTVVMQLTYNDDVLTWTHTSTTTAFRIKKNVLSLIAGYMTTSIPIPLSDRCCTTTMYISWFSGFMILINLHFYIILTFDKEHRRKHEQPTPTQCYRVNRCVFLVAWDSSSYLTFD